MAKRNEDYARQKHVGEELRVLYQVTAQDLAFFKQQQWLVTNYVLLLFGAFFGVSQVERLKVGLCERFVLCLAATVLAVVGLMLICKLEKSIAARRDRLQNIRHLFTETFREAWRSQHKACDSSAIARLLGTMMLGGAAFVWWFVYAKLFMSSQ